MDGVDVDGRRRWQCRLRRWSSSGENVRCLFLCSIRLLQAFQAFPSKQWRAKPYWVIVEARTSQASLHQKVQKSIPLCQWSVALAVAAGNQDPQKTRSTRYAPSLSRGCFFTRFTTHKEGATRERELDHYLDGEIIMAENSTPRTISRTLTTVPNPNNLHEPHLQLQRQRD